MKIVKKATIEIIKPEEVKVGDYILYSNFRCKVIEIKDFGSTTNAQYVRILQFEDEPESAIWIPRYGTFYRVLEAEEVELYQNKEGQYVEVICKFFKERGCTNENYFSFLYKGKWNYERKCLFLNQSYCILKLAVSKQ